MGYITDDRNVQMIISLMIHHDIVDVVACPGSGCVTLIASLQDDSRFNLYSAIDERSAGYMACGIAREKNHPVALIITGNVASRDCAPALTEAFYSNIPILLLTTSHPEGASDNGWPQILDNRSQFNDISVMNIHLPLIFNTHDEWNNSIQLNKAFLKMLQEKKPVQIYYCTTFGRDYSCQSIPEMQIVNYYENSADYPILEAKEVVVYIGSHQPFSNKETTAIELFCEKYNGVVFCDQTSNYRGRYRIQASLLWEQKKYNSPLKQFDTMIHIGGISGQYVIPKPKEVWRVSPSGRIKDSFQRLKNVFKTDELSFFSHYNDCASDRLIKIAFYDQWYSQRSKLLSKIPELPFSNAWIAQKSVNIVPKNSILYLGILNTLRSWNFFDIKNDVKCISNVGAFGTDGGLSTLLGVSLVNKDKTCFCILGDLSFFYDMNALGNRDVNSNIRIMLINNGMGTEFKNYAHHATSIGDKADKYVAAKGHFSKPDIVKNYVESLGFKYLRASSKMEYTNNCKIFWSEEKFDCPIVFEVLTVSSEESEALRLLYTLF